MSSELSVGISEGRGETVVTVTGEVDIASAPALAEALNDALATGARRVVVDLSGLGFMDLSGLRVLTSSIRRARETGARIVLANPSSSVRRLVTLTGTERILEPDGNR